LEVAGEDEKMLIMSDILPEIHKLRIDIFGNYVVQKLFDFGTAKMIEKVKQTIVGDMLILSNQVYGCRVVQKALEIVNDDSLLELLSELHGNVLSCIHDQNGNHVIQKCIEVVNKRASQNEGRGNLEMARLFKHETQIILDCVTEDILALSRHPYGCRVFQRILEHFDEKQKDHILNCICNFHEELLDDQYGNYVIQHVLRFGRTSDRDSVLNIVVKNGLLHLSRQKFASNVVEKLLKYGNDNHRKVIVHEMLKVVQINGMDGNVDESSVVLMMVRDAYANYVVQTTLDVVPEGEEKRLLFEELNSHAALLVSRRCTYMCDKKW
jgi:pumilio RNA-binding family